jgi:Xaa-Pro aminopeptidase
MIISTGEGRSFVRAKLEVSTIGELSMNQNHTSDILTLPFPLEEFARRRNLVLEEMRESRLDAIVITSVANIYYTTGLPNVFPLGLFALVLRSDGEGFWIGRRIELSNAHSIVAVTGWSQVGRAINDDEDPYDAFAEGLFSLVERKARIGFEMDSRSFPRRPWSIESPVPRASR